jgi:hypothetical protein
MSYVYNFFDTKENISAKKLQRIPNIFSKVNPLSPPYPSPIYILRNEYKLEIDEYIKKNDILKFENDLKKIEILKKISDDYFLELKNNNIEDFVKDLIYTKDEITTIKDLIDNYFKLEKKLNYNIINNSKKNISYNNPINFKNKNNLLNKDFFSNSINSTIYNKKYNEIVISTNILLIGNIINNSLPSIGLVDIIFYPLPHLNPKKPITIVSFIDTIINNNIDIENQIPLKSLKIGETISSILLNIKRNINNIDNLDNNIFNKEKFRNKDMDLLIKNMINNIKIDIKDIFIKKSNDKKKNIIQKEYIIPYKFKDSSFISDEIIYLSKSSEIENIKDINLHNKTVIINVIKKINLNPSEKLNEKYYKNVLACFLFYVIRIFYDIFNEYINRIDALLIQILDIKEKRFGILNIKDAFEYTSLLKTSLYKFKLILLNNFYQLFIPSKFLKNNYGMEKDSNNCYIPEINSIFLNSNQNIFNNYPFKLDISSNITVTELNTFILNIKENNDIYNSNDILEFGGYSFDKEIMKISTEKINEYYTLLQKNNNFTLFIIEKLIDNFIIKENIPYELISDLELIEPIMRKLSINPEEKDKITKFLLYKFNYNIEKSTNYYIKLLDIRNKIKESKKMNVNTLYNIEEIYKICFKIYYIKASCIIPITENILNDIKLKNTLLAEYFKIKKSFEKNISKYISKISK